MPDRKKKKSSKRPPMRTATDVINRIIWDEEIPSDLITVGYEDRFLGVVEKPFNDFSWEPLDSIDYYTFGIPKHRIQYFKYRDVIIWDKNSLTDNVFGSLGSGITISDVMQQSDRKADEMSSRPSIKPTDDESASEDDDDIMFLLDSNSGNPPAVLESEGESADDEDKYWQNKLRPNFFICQRIDAPEFLEQAQLIQTHFRAIDPGYESCCIPAECSHMTLRTLRLDNAEQVAECVRTLKEAREELSLLLPTEPLCIQGLGNFHDRVVYAAVQPSDQLSAFVEHLDLVLHSSGLRLTDGRDYVPHITLVKLLFHNTAENSSWRE